ncbi:ankyrin repeat domain-containing protein [Parashewanella tropica]|uniref:ankyrin repeat domain-containing protein n=1 Tax=Parashewanella tropica TaxID=2547970 RepID=UPI001059889F|nr:ankyrin repeat domain-containing protein [Parashewanella tropica]
MAELNVRFSVPPLEWTVLSEHVEGGVSLKNAPNDNQSLTKQFTAAGLQMFSPHQFTQEFPDGVKDIFVVKFCPESKQWCEFHQGEKEPFKPTSPDSPRFPILQALNGLHSSEVLIHSANGELEQLKTVLCKGVNLCRFTSQELSLPIETEDAHLVPRYQLSQTPLHLAVIFKKFHTTQELLSVGAPINVVNSEGNTPLHEAVIEGDEAIFMELLAKNKSLVYTDNALLAKNKFGFPPLGLSVHHRRTTMTKAILEQNPDLAFTAVNGNLILAQALIERDIEHIELLMEFAQRKMEPNKFKSWITHSLSQLLNSNCDVKTAMVKKIFEYKPVTLTIQKTNMMVKTELKGREVVKYQQTNLLLMAINSQEFEVATLLLEHFFAKDKALQTKDLEEPIDIVTRLTQEDMIQQPHAEDLLLKLKEVKETLQKAVNT